MVTKGLPSSNNDSTSVSRIHGRGDRCGIDPMLIQLPVGRTIEPRSGIDVERTVSAIAGAMVNAESTTQDFPLPGVKKNSGTIESDPSQSPVPSTVLTPIKTSQDSGYIRFRL